MEYLGSPLPRPVQSNGYAAMRRLGLDDAIRLRYRPPVVDQGRHAFITRPSVALRSLRGAMSIRSSALAVLVGLLISACGNLLGIEDLSEKPNPEQPPDAGAPDAKQPD